MVAVQWHQATACCAQRVSSRLVEVTELARSAQRDSMRMVKAAGLAQLVERSVSKTNLDRPTAKRVFIIVKQDSSTRAAGVVLQAIAWSVAQGSIRHWQA